MWHAQAVEEAKAAKAAEKAQREARKAERQEELEKKIGSTKAFKPTTSAFAALNDDSDEVEEKREKTKKQMRRAGRKKKDAEDGGGSSSMQTFTRVSLMIVLVAVVVGVLAQGPETREMLLATAAKAFNATWAASDAALVALFKQR